MNPETIEAVLGEVREMGPVTAAEIAESTGLSETSVRGALKRLEQFGAVASDAYYPPARHSRKGRTYMAT
jgi:predicted ArsR family transcriptional regulator